MTRPVIRAAVLALSVGVLAGCGAEDPDEAAIERERTEERASDLVTAAEVRAAPAESPQEAVLTWWRALQFRDASTVRRMFTSEARDLIGASLSETVFLDLGPNLQQASPEILNVETVGESAVVYVRIRRNQIVSPKIIRQTAEYQGLALRRENGRWRIDDPTYFLQAGRQLREARLRAAEAARAAERE